MARKTSKKVLVAAASPQTAEVFIYLMVFRHPEINTADNALYFANNVTDVQSNGKTYTAYPFEIVLPSEGETMSTAQLEMDVVDLAIIETLRQLTTPPEIELRLVLADTPDVTELGPHIFELNDVHVSYPRLTATLAFGTKYEAVYPRIRKTPKSFPGLF